MAARFQLGRDVLIVEHKPRVVFQDAQGLARSIGVRVEQPEHGTIDRGSHSERIINRAAPPGTRKFSLQKISHNVPKNGGKMNAEFAENAEEERGKCTK